MPRGVKGRKPLVEIIESFQYKIVEGSGVEGKPFIVEGVMQRADVENENKRVYPFKLWETNLAENSAVMRRIHERGMFGELDHPDDGQTRLRRTSHIITHLWLDEQGTVWGRAEILPTEAGKQLRVLFEAKTKVGVSSRGAGEVVEKGGREIVQEDYLLEAFDFVYNPSTPGAYPIPVVEQTDKNEKGKVMLMAESLGTFRGLEQTARKILAVDVAKAAPDALRLAESTATDLIHTLSVLSEQAPDVKVLADGLLTELTAYKRASFKKLSEWDDVTPQILKRLKTPGMEGAPYGTEIPPEPKGTDKNAKAIAGEKKEGKKMEAGKKVLPRPVPKALSRALREADAEIDKIEEEDDQRNAAREKQTTEAVRRTEARLARLTHAKLKGFKLREEEEEEEEEDDDTANFGGKKAPPFTGKEEEFDGDDKDDDDDDEDLPEAAPPESEIPGPEDDTGEKEFMKGPGGGTPKTSESKKRRFHEEEEEEEEEEDDVVDVPPPPADEEEEEEEEEEESVKATPFEARMLQAIKRLVRENRNLRYQRKVTEAVAASALAKLVKRGKRLEAAFRRHKAAPTTFTVRGQKIESKLVPLVIESLVRQCKARKRVSEAREDTDAGERMHGALPGVRPMGDVSLLNEGRLPRRGASSRDNVLAEQIDLSDRVYDRLAPKTTLAEAGAKK